MWNDFLTATKHVDTLTTDVSAKSYIYSLQGHAKGDAAAED